CIERGGVNDGIFPPRGDAKSDALRPPPDLAISRNEEAAARDLATRQAQPEKGRCLMLGGVDDRLTEDGSRVRDQDVINGTRPKVLKPCPRSRPAQPREHGAGRASMQVSAERDVQPPKLAHGAK